MIYMKANLYEWKKILWYRKGLLLIILFVLLRILSLLLFDQPMNSDIINYEEGYQYYLAMTEGKLDEVKVTLFEEISNDFSEAESRLQTIYSDYSDGEINESEYQSRLSSLEATMSYKPGFLVLFKQFIYARADQENRYLLDTNAWDALLSHDTLNILLVIVIMILTLVNFGAEISCEMDTLIRITKNGEQRTAKMKLAITSLLSMCACLLNFIVEYIFYQCKYGFSHSNAPIQSLSYFGEYTGSCSLGQAMLSMLLYKMLGCWFWGILVSVIVVLVKKYSLAMVISLSALLLPYYGISSSYIKYYAPYPLGLMVATGYFRGTIQSYDDYTPKETIAFLQIPDEVRNIVLMASILIIFFACCIVIHQYTNCWKKVNIKRVSASIMLLLLSSILGTGCAKQNVTAPDYYNMDQIYNYENKDYLVYTDFSDLEAIDISYENKKTGEIGSIVKDAFSEDKEIYSFFYGVGHYIYYLELSYDYAERGLSSKYDKFSVICVDLNDFSYRTVYQANANMVPSVALGLGEIYDQDTRLYTSISAFFVHNEYIYIAADSTMWSVRLSNGERKMLFSYTNGEVSFDGDAFYYLDEMSRLTRYVMDEEKIDKSIDIVASWFKITKDSIIYKDRMHADSLFVLNLDSMEHMLLTQENVLSFTTDGANVFYISDTMKIYEVSLLGGEHREIGSCPSVILYAFRSSEYLYVPHFGDEGITKILK